MSIRASLDLHEVNAALQREETYASIAQAQRSKTGLNVTRSLIAGIDRDIKAGKLKPLDVKPQTTGRGLRPLTYVYGREKDNGGLPRFSGKLTVENNRALIISDVHLPYTNYRALEQLPAIAERYGIEALYIIGDWLDGDSRHHKRRTRRVTLSEQARTSREVFEYFDSEGVFNEYVYLGGNHDNWFAYDTDGELEFPDIARLAIPASMEDRFIVSPYDQLTIISGGVEWNAFHQDDYSKDPLAVARTMALKYQSNVICTHMHMTAWGYDIYGRYKTVAVGGLLDPTMLEYKALNSNRMPETTSGIMILIDGEEKIITDFDRL